MAAHRLGEPTSGDENLPERVRVRIALGVTHDPVEAEEILREIRVTEPDEAEDRRIIAFASRDHVSKYSACFESATIHEGEAASMLIYDTDSADSGPGKSDDPVMAAFKKQMLSFESWMAPTLITRMKNHLARSALVIAVVVDSQEQEQALCEILLRRAVDYIYVQDVPDLPS